MNQIDCPHQKNVLETTRTHIIIPRIKLVMLFDDLGYRTDDIAVRALLQKDFKYLGLLGSKRTLKDVWIIKTKGL